MDLDRRLQAGKPAGRASHPGRVRRDRPRREPRRGRPAPGYKTFGGYGTLPGGLPFLPSGGLSGWAPGKMPVELPKGVGRYIPAGADVLLQIHYHKSGKDEADRSAIGLYFAKGTIDKQLKAGHRHAAAPGLFARPTLIIPAGDANYEIKGAWTAGYDAHLLSVLPHMHWLGKDFILDSRSPGRHSKNADHDR